MSRLYFDENPIIAAVKTSEALAVDSSTRITIGLNCIMPLPAVILSVFPSRYSCNMTTVPSGRKRDAILARASR
jgi:hypothetical protein